MSVYVDGIWSTRGRRVEPRPALFTVGDGRRLIARRGAGGLVSSLAPLVRGTGATWMAAAITDGDRVAAAGGVVEAEGFRFRSLAIDPTSTAWPRRHLQRDALVPAPRPVRPAAAARIDRRWREA